MSTEAEPADLILSAEWVLPVSSRPIRQGAVAIQDGRIRRVGPAAEVNGACRKRLDLGEAALLPGFVNVHTHLELTLLRGLCEEAEFVSWIRRLTGIKYSRLDAAAFRLAARWGALEALRGGVTTVGDASDSGQVAGALVESGLRGIAYQEVFGPDERQCDEALAALEARLEAEQSQVREAGRRVQVGVSPHAPYTVSAPLFRRVSELAAARGLPLCVHAAESRAEGELLRLGTGAFADRLRQRGIPWKAPGLSPIAYLERLGVLEARPLLIHAVDVSPDDVDRIRKAGAAVAHCPKSNAKLGHGAAPLLEFLQAPIRTGLGTDGVVSNNGCDCLEEARFALLMQRARLAHSAQRASELDAPAFLRFMTLGGAEALGLEAEIGSIEAGKLADLTAVDLSGPHHRPLFNPETSIIFSASARDVVMTMVEGKVLYERGSFSTLDAASLRAEVEETAARLSLPE